MTITEQQAIEWAGSATADQLTAVPAGRLTTDMGRHMLSISTSVVHCLIPGGPQPPILPLPETRPQPIIWCEEVLRRDAQKRQTFDGHAKYAHTSVLGDSGFLKTFGREETLQLRSPKLPFVRLMCDPQVSAAMYGYIREAVQWMMQGGTARNNFRPLLWAGLRDWVGSSAWTRGVVLLYAQWYKKTVQEGHTRHLQAQEQLMENLLMDIGLHPSHQLHCLPHLPSLTARQARRSRVEEPELRERWG